MKHEKSMLSTPPPAANTCCSQNPACSETLPVSPTLTSQVPIHANRNGADNFSPAARGHPGAPADSAYPSSNFLIEKVEARWVVGAGLLHSPPYISGQPPAKSALPVSRFPVQLRMPLRATGIYCLTSDWGWRE